MTGLAFPEISPIIVEFGPVAVRWYSMAYLAGIVAAWFLTLRNVKKYNLPFTKQQIEDLAFYATLGIIIGGRLGYVLFYGGNMFWKQPWQIFAIWNGGMSFHGGILGVIIGMYLFAKKQGFRFLQVADIVALYAPIGIFLGRLANFVNDELWGRPSDVAWAVRFPSGGYIPRHPSQLYEAFTEGLLMFIILNLLWRHKWVRDRVGFVSAMFAVLYGGFRMFIEQFREPDAQLGFFFGHITMGQMLSVPLAVAGLIVIYMKVTRGKG